FLLLAKIDQLAFQTIAGRAPLVLHNKGSAIEAESLVGRVELVQLGHGSLDQRRQRNRLIHSHGDITYAELERVKKRVRADVPPYFLGIIDAVCLDEQLDEIVVFPPTGEIIRNIGAGKFVKDFATIRFQSRVHSQPEGRIGRECQNMRQEITRMIHHVDSGLAILYPDVHVQAENQVSARHQLHVLNNVLVAIAGSDFLGAPISKGMGGRRNQTQSIFSGDRKSVV